MECARGGRHRLAGPVGLPRFLDWHRSKPWYDDATRLVEASTDAGLDIVPMTTAGRSEPLVHAVGMHYFHWWDLHRGGGEERITPTTAQALGADYVGDYQNEEDFRLITFAPFESYILTALDAAGTPVTWDVGNLGFPSGRSPTAVTELLSYDSTPEYRTAYHLRMALYLLSLGAGHVFAYSHMNNIGPRRGTGVLTNAVAGQYALMGVRYDEPSGAGIRFTAAEDARPRSAWLGLQRLAWLLSYARSVDWVWNEEGRVAILLTARGTGFPSSPTAGPLDRRFPFAHVFWLDKKAAEEWIVLSLSVQDGAFARIPLVPRDPAAAGEASDTTGYATAAGEIDWGDAEPDNLFRFGHADQWFVPTSEEVRVRIFRTAAPRASEGGVTTVVDHLGTPADLGNVGIIAWLSDLASLAMVEKAT